MIEAFTAHPVWFTLVVTIVCGTVFMSIDLVSVRSYNKVLQRENTKRMFKKDDHG
jgi:hypothetical protein